jgi:hypothetical protein
VARDVVRYVQDHRKQCRLNVSDRIELWLDGSAELRAAAEANRDMILRETLAVALRLEAGGEQVAEVKLEDEKLRIGLTKAG